MNVILAITGMVFKEIYRKKDFYVAFILITVIMLYTSQLTFYNVENISRYIREISLSLIYIFSIIIVIPLAARQIPSERSQRTIGVLLSKPVSRLQLILGKFVGSFLASLSCFLIFYAIFILMSVSKGALMDTVMLVQSGFLFSLCIMIVAAMTICVSHFFTFGATVTFCLILYFLMATYGDKLDLYAMESYGIGKYIALPFYYILPHFEFFDVRQRLIHDWGALPWNLMGVLTTYAFIVTSVFIIASWLKLRKASL